MKAKKIQTNVRVRFTNNGWMYNQFEGTEKEAREYYRVGSWFDIGDSGEPNMREVASVELMADRHNLSGKELCGWESSSVGGSLIWSHKDSNTIVWATPDLNVKGFTLFEYGTADEGGDSLRRYGEYPTPTVNEYLRILARVIDFIEGNTD
jgi:hypothetical protein